MTRRRSPTTTGNVERFHETLRRELLDETGGFASIEATHAAIDEWVHAYNTVRPHQSLDMATPASLFRSRVTDPDLRSDADVGRPDKPANAIPRMRPPKVRSGPLPIEMEARVPAPSGVVVIAGLQQLWVGKDYAGLTVTLWIHLTSIHILLADRVIKTVSSRVTTADLGRLSLARRSNRTTRPAEPAPPTTRSNGRPTPIEIERTANRDGIVVVRGQMLALGSGIAGTRVTLDSTSVSSTPGWQPHSGRYQTHSLSMSSERSQAPGLRRHHRPHRDRQDLKACSGGFPKMVS
ncbi:integrase core domain-containing protein [Mycolicibacterium baixiangningiae]|uniref:integrase core domain-containing protein n=1 Tax=Mycolicibacterium baixiangningiae TaxID=2761578 RepID=UPI0018D1EF9E|nr:integrase core domain-containing protein [Mycolicibacterium baixiangningiae]